MNKAEWLLALQVSDYFDKAHYLLIKTISFANSTTAGGKMRICGSADVDMGKMRISVWIKIHTLPVGSKFFAKTYFQNLSTLHCYYCR